MIIISETLKPMFERAKHEHLWFRSVYQDLWFTPEELEFEQEQGRFRWGVENWQLRDPAEKLKRLEKEIEDAQSRYFEFRKRMGI